MSEDQNLPEGAIPVLNKGFVKLVDSMGSDASIVQSARVSYGKGTKTINEDVGLIRYLMRHSHTTPLEMVQFKFHIKAPIFIFRQWHRHRMWSYNEYSGRYSEMKDEFYVPEENRITKQSSTNKQGSSSNILTWEDYTTFQNNKHAPEGQQLTFTNKSIPEEFQAEQKILREWYEDYVELGMSKELARINLPLSQYSEMYASVDLHNLFHFLKLRLDSHAQYEIRVYAEAIYQLIKPIVPIACEAFEDYTLNSKKLSGKDFTALKDLFGILIPEEESSKLEPLLELTASHHFTNKREKEEFVEKIKSFFKK
jgi:thymidylate synthase (FAD)